MGQYYICAGDLHVILLGSGIFLLRNHLLRKEILQHIYDKEEIGVFGVLV